MAPLRVFMRPYDVGHVRVEAEASRVRVPPVKGKNRGHHRRLKVP